jgi:predicted nuclease of predicted toxin-antitoxin system
LKFKIDENLPVEIADLLRVKNFQADTVNEENLSGENDSNISIVCKKEDRILITLDLDFSDIRNYPPNEYPGFIVLRLKSQDKQSIISLFNKFIPFIQRENIQNKLCILEENKIRIRE